MAYVLDRIPVDHWRHLPALPFDATSAQPEVIDQGNFEVCPGSSAKKLMTFGLSACTGVVMWDVSAGVFGLAHRDATNPPLANMLQQMLSKGAVKSGIKVVLYCNEEFNQSGPAAYEDLAALGLGNGQIKIYRGEEQGVWVSGPAQFGMPRDLASPNVPVRVSLGAEDESAILLQYQQQRANRTLKPATKTCIVCYEPVPIASAFCLECNGQSFMH